MNLAGMFALPGLLPLVLLVPAAFALLLWWERRRERALRSAVGERFDQLANDLSGDRRQRRRLFAAGGLCVGVLALAQPLWGGADADEPGGVDIVVCLDVSRSMLAGDVAPNRLAAAQREIRELAHRLRGDRLALVVFAGQARVLVPLTDDMASFESLLELADPLAVGRGGTDLGAALDVAVRALGTAEGPGVVLLLTDGEDHEGRGRVAAQACAARGITVHCVGLGSPAGSKIVADGRDGGFVRDRTGQEVVTALDPASLQAIAAATGGEFVLANRAPLPLVGLYEQRIAPIQRVAQVTEARRTAGNRYQWPLLLAIVFWMLELCCTERKPH